MASTFSKWLSCSKATGPTTEGTMQGRLICTETQQTWTRSVLKHGGEPPFWPSPFTQPGRDDSCQLLTIIVSGATTLPLASTLCRLRPSAVVKDINTCSILVVMVINNIDSCLTLHTIIDHSRSTSPA
eukprot:2772564-Rhodomonas_salina.1